MKFLGDQENKAAVDAGKLTLPCLTGLRLTKPPEENPKIKTVSRRRKEAAPASTSKQLLNGPVGSQIAVGNHQPRSVRFDDEDLTGLIHDYNENIRKGIGIPEDQLPPIEIRMKANVKMGAHKGKLRGARVTSSNKLVSKSGDEIMDFDDLLISLAHQSQQVLADSDMKQMKITRNGTIMLPTLTMNVNDDLKDAKQKDKNKDATMLSHAGSYFVSNKDTKMPQIESAEGIKKDGTYVVHNVYRHAKSDKTLGNLTTSISGAVDAKGRTRSQDMAGNPEKGILVARRHIIGISKVHPSFSPGFKPVKHNTLVGPNYTPTADPRKVGPSPGYSEAASSSRVSMQLEDGHGVKYREMAPASFKQPSPKKSSSRLSLAEYRERMELLHRRQSMTDAERLKKTPSRSPTKASHSVMSMASSTMLNPPPSSASVDTESHLHLHSSMTDSLRGTPAGDHSNNATPTQALPPLGYRQIHRRRSEILNKVNHVSSTSRAQYKTMESLRAANRMFQGLSEAPYLAAEEYIHPLRDVTVEPYRVPSIHIIDEEEDGLPLTGDNYTLESYRPAVEEHGTPSGGILKSPTRHMIKNNQDKLLLGHLLNIPERNVETKVSFPHIGVYNPK